MKILLRGESTQLGRVIPRHAPQDAKRFLVCRRSSYILVLPFVVLPSSLPSGSHLTQRSMSEKPIKIHKTGLREYTMFNGEMCSKTAKN